MRCGLWRCKRNRLILPCYLFWHTLKSYYQNFFARASNFFSTTFWRTVWFAIMFPKSLVKHDHLTLNLTFPKPNPKFLWFFYFFLIFTAHISLCCDSGIMLYLDLVTFHLICPFGFLVPFSKWNTDFVQEQWMGIFLQCSATSNEISSLPLIFAFFESWMLKILLQLQPQVVEYLFSK